MGGHVMRKAGGSFDGTVGLATALLYFPTGTYCRPSDLTYLTV